MKARPNDSAETVAIKTKASQPAAKDDTPDGSDADLVRRFKDGDESGFPEIVRRHYARIHALANRTLRFTGDVDEVTQDTFIRAHRNLCNFRGDCSLGTWLYRIGLNLARNRYWFHFHRRRQNTLSLDRCMNEAGCQSLMDILSNGSASPLSESTTHEFLALVAQSIERLDERHREILTMRTAQELSYEEIATKLSLNVGTVKSRIARARTQLWEQLHELAPEFGRDATANDLFEVDHARSHTVFYLN